MSRRTVRVIGWLLMLLVMSLETRAMALEPRLYWKKEFKQRIGRIDLAAETGDVVLDLDAREIILFDKDGLERYHWGPRTDRGSGSVTISWDGRYFAFSSGYSEEYAFSKGVHWTVDDRIHFYGGQTKRELWNVKTIGSPSMFPDGSSVLVAAYSSSVLNIYDRQGKQMFACNQDLGLPSVKISPDSGYFALIRDSNRALELYRRDGTKLWERGRHNVVASISEGARYVSTAPCVCYSDTTTDPQNASKGLIYDRNGNVIMEGYGILSPNGTRVAMLSPEKVSILSLPEKKTIKEVPVSIWDVFDIDGVTIAVFSYDGRYLILRNGGSLLAIDLIEGPRKEINVPSLGRSSGFFVSRDGRYLLVRPGDSQPGMLLYYYQLY